VEVGLELVVGDAPVLNRHAGRDRRRAVAVDRARADREVARMEAPGLPVPVDASAADAGAWQKGAELADRQRVLLEVVAQRPRLVGGVLEELVADRVAKLVVVVGPVLDAPVVAAFEPDDAEAGLRQLRGDDPSDPADTDDADVCLLVGHLTSLPTTC